MFPQFAEIWCVDFEFYAPSGERPEPICAVFKELRTGRVLRFGYDELRELSGPPIPGGPGVLFVAYYASAEFGCYLALNWSRPENTLDLFCEFRNATNGLQAFGNSLIGALKYFRCDSIESKTKEALRALAMRGGPWNSEEQAALLDYCQADVEGLERLVNAMAPQIDIPRALIRGRYMWTVAVMERNGVPIDTPALEILKTNWDRIKSELVSRIDSSGIYEGTTFKYDRFEAFLASQGLPWPRLESGRLDLTDATFKEQARRYPDTIGPLRELRGALSQLKLNALSVGRDGRNRCLLSPFSSRSGRNQPSNVRFVFGPATWLRSLIRPEPGFGLAYIDFSQQEFAIAAALSNDTNMMEAYKSGDVYLAFAKQAGLAPPEATKQSHKSIRDLCKTIILGTQYGMGPVSLAKRIDKSEPEAVELLKLHHRTYSTFWNWSDSVNEYAHLHGKLWTVFGWNQHFEGQLNSRSIRNFLMQSNGGEMLRLACIYTVTAGIKLCAPIHDAILIEYPLAQADEIIKKTRECMVRASRDILGGFEVRTDVDRIDYPARYSDPRGEKMWGTVWEIIGVDPDGVSPTGDGSVAYRGR